MTRDPFVLAIDRRYTTKAKKPKAMGEITYYHDGKCEFTRTTAVIPWFIENAPPSDPQAGDSTNLLRWYMRTRDLPGAREAYAADTKSEAK